MAIDVKEAISKKPIEILGRLVDASNATLFGILEETEINIIYKPISGERPLWDFEEGSLAGREVAAYLTSEFMNFNLVPFTTLREGPFGLGMVQHWVEVENFRKVTMNGCEVWRFLTRLLITPIARLAIYCQPKKERFLDVTMESLST